MVWPMNLVLTSADSIAFGRFRLLPRRRELLADGEPVKLGGRAFDVLMALIEAHGAVVSKDELIARVWPGRVVVETNLQTQISALRAAFGAERELIRTVSGRGYQFTGEITCLPGLDKLAAGATAARGGPRGRPSDKPAGAGFRADWPRCRARGDPGPGRGAPARHPDRRRRHRQDAARPRGGAPAAAAFSRWGLAGRVLAAHRSRPGSCHRCRGGRARAWRRRDLRAAGRAGARRAAAPARAGHLRARDRRCRGADGRGRAACRFGRLASSPPAASRCARRASSSIRCRRSPYRRKTPRMRRPSSHTAQFGLFVERRARRSRILRLDRLSAATIAAICRRLDGIPLAIELAAARARRARRRRDRRAPRRSLPAADRRQAHGAAAPPDLAGDARLELRAAGGARAGAPASPGGVRRRLQPRGGRRGRGERRDRARRKSSMASPAWSRSRWYVAEVEAPSRATACSTRPALMRSRSSPKAASANGSRAAMPNITGISSSGPKSSWRDRPTAAWLGDVTEAWIEVHGPN